MLQGKNGYLPYIGWKDRFLVVNAKKNKQIEQKNATPLQTRLGFSSNTLQEHVRKPANKQWKSTSKDGLDKTK